jgi:N-acetylneuraminic acid mutarotase
MTWEYLKPEGPYVPRPRCGHTATQISSSKFVVIGGNSGSDYFSDVHVFDVETKIWERINIPAAAAPAKRYLHSANLVNNMIYVFGGASGDQCFSDVSILDLDNWQWFGAELRGTIPTDRCGHSTAVINQSIILVYGGQDFDHDILGDIYAFDCGKFYKKFNF